MSGGVGRATGLGGGGVAASVAERCERGMNEEEEVCARLWMEIKAKEAMK